MSQTSNSSTATVPTALALEREARRLGYVPGFPAALRPPARQADLGVCRRLRCPGCGTRGMGGKPFHRPGQVGGYRVVAVCPRCGAGEEV